VSVIKSGKRVWVGDTAATPVVLVSALLDRARELRDVEIVCGFIGWPTSPEPFNADDPVIKRAFRTNLYFAGPFSRVGYQRKYPHSRYIPINLGETSDYASGALGSFDYALMTVSPPDRHGWCSCGPSPAGAPIVLARAGTLIGEVNKRTPRTHGGTWFHVSHFDSIIEVDRPLVELPPVKAGADILEIGKRIAELVPDGACIQAGIGGLPDAVMANLRNHRDLGVHTEMFGDGVVDLANLGVITGKHKVTDPGRIVASFCMGTQKLYDAIDDNPMYWFDCAGYTNDFRISSQNPKLYAINTALEADLSGQVGADMIHGMQLSGVGGQVEFAMGASLSEGGRPIIDSSQWQVVKNRGKIPRRNIRDNVKVDRSNTRHRARSRGLVGAEYQEAGDGHHQTRTSEVPGRARERGRRAIWVRINE
jgi:acyl-CoA hydrolase